MLPSRDTIFALSSGRPPAAIAVVRLSGPSAGDALKELTGKIPEPRKAALARVRDPANGDVIDEALALWFPGPNSETGEDTAELQLHGGRAVIAAVLAALGRIEGLRMAEPGEFTRRAFENGRLDLTAVEGLADLIGAETEAQRRQAYRQLKGLLGDRAETWRARLRDGLVIAIAGPPNAGKSTLLNRIARREAAIVSPIAGTTRDVIEVHLDLGGYPVTMLDTAGIRDSDDPLEQEGVRRARERAADADLVLWVQDVKGKKRPENSSAGPLTWIVWNKIDLNRNTIIEESNDEFKLSDIEFYISATTGHGFEAFLDYLARFAASYFGAEPALVSRERHRKMLETALRALDDALAEGERGREDIIAEELRRAANTFGRLTGRIDVEDVLDVIFRDFCIGK